MKIALLITGRNERLARLLESHRNQGHRVFELRAPDALPSVPVDLVDADCLVFSTLAIPSTLALQNLGELLNREAVIALGGDAGRTVGPARCLQLMGAWRTRVTSWRATDSVPSHIVVRLPGGDLLPLS